MNGQDDARTNGPADRVLAYVATFNDADIVADCLDALRRQSHPIEKILIVDNDSADDIGDTRFPDDVEFIRHPVNLGTSGSAHTALQYGLAHDFDWVWVFDADSVPEDDALRASLDFYRGLAAQDREQVFFIGSLPIDAPTGFRQHGVVFNEHGMVRVEPPDLDSAYRCDATMWTGSLYRMAAVRDVGLPDVDYVLDLGDIAYGYTGFTRGYRSYIHQQSVINHNLHAISKVRDFQLGGVSVKAHASPPFRRYYTARNTIYFWLYEYRGPRNLRVLKAPLGGLFKSLVKLAVLPGRSMSGLWASARGVWHGLRGRIGLERRYHRPSDRQLEISN